MKRPLMIIGAGGHGRVASDIAQLIGYDEIFFLDDADVPNKRVVGKVADFVKFIGTCDFFVAIGANGIREAIYAKIKKEGANIVNLIHPNAIISNNVSIGQGVVVMAGTVINNGATICDGAIINTCSSVDHDCYIEDFVHIAVGAHLAGTVKVGKRTFIGAGVTVINNITICAESIVGAGAVVIRDIKEKGTYVGVPVRKL